MPSKVRPKIRDDMEQTTSSTARGGARKSLCSVRRKRTMCKMDVVELPLKSGRAADELRRSSVGTEKCKKKFCGGGRESENSTALVEGTSSHSIASQAKGAVNSSNSGNRRMDKHLAMIFMGIVLIFLGQ